MSLCPEAAAFLGTPRVTVPVTKSVRLLTGREEHEDLAADIPQSIKGPEPANEDTMPKTSTTEAEKPKRKYTRRQQKLVMSLEEKAPAPKQVRNTLKAVGASVVFSVDSTGALLIRRGDHSMEFSAVEVDQLMAFMEKSRILWAPE